MSVGAHCCRQGALDNAAVEFQKVSPFSREQYLMNFFVLQAYKW